MNTKADPEQYDSGQDGNPGSEDRDETLEIFGDLFKTSCDPKNIEK